MILQKVNFFRFFKTIFWVQALHLEEKVRNSTYTHFENKSIKFSYMCNFIAVYAQERSF